MAILGIVANPASGKDIRRLVARASVFDNQEKQAIVRRALAGAHAAAKGKKLTIAYLDDGHGIVREALADRHPDCLKSAHIAAAAETVSALDTTAAARALRAMPAAVVITLGGDGTNRAFALGWPEAPLIPISTGTNNVFPELVEATVAGAAAGLIATGAVALSEVARSQKLIRIEIDNEAPDMALIDAVLVEERFVGARAILDPQLLRRAVLTRADPAAVGITAIGGLLAPIARDTNYGMRLEFGQGITLQAPIAPGYYCSVQIASHSDFPFGSVVEWTGPGVLALDGERERVLRPGQRARVSIDRSGPLVVDVRTTLTLAAERGCFVETRS